MGLKVQSVQFVNLRCSLLIHIFRRAARRRIRKAKSLLVTWPANFRHFRFKEFQTSFFKFATKSLINLAAEVLLVEAMWTRYFPLVQATPAQLQTEIGGLIEFGRDRFNFSDKCDQHCLF